MNYYDRTRSCEKRIKRLERMARATEKIRRVHYHDRRDPRESCPECMKMTETEYMDFKQGKVSQNFDDLIIKVCPIGERDIEVTT